VALTYVLVDGSVVEESFAALTDIASRPNRAADGSLIDGSQIFVWTGSQLDGEGFPASLTCNDWTSKDSRGVIGDGGRTTFEWTQRIVLPCQSSRHIYCIEG